MAARRLGGASPREAQLSARRREIYATADGALFVTMMRRGRPGTCDEAPAWDLRGLGSTHVRSVTDRRFAVVRERRTWPSGVDGAAIPPGVMTLVARSVSTRQWTLTPDARLLGRTFSARSPTRGDRLRKGTWLENLDPRDERAPSDGGIGDRASAGSGTRAFLSHIARCCANSRRTARYGFGGRDRRVGLACFA